MRQTLFYIPLNDQVLSFLLIAWAVGSVLMLAWLVRRQGFSSDTLSYLPLLAIVGAVIYFVLPALRTTDAITGQSGLPVRGYGVLLLLAMASGVALAVYRARRAGHSPEIIYGLAFWLFAGGILCARAFYVIEYWPQFRRESLAQTVLAIVNIAQGGLVVYGSAIGAALGMALYCRRRSVRFLWLADLITPSLMVGLALGRIGCFLTGCCFGDLCSLPWAVEFPAHSPPHARQVERGMAWGVQLIGVPGEEQQRPAIVIAQVLPGTPAAEQGLKVGERVQRINGHNVESLSDAAGVLYTAMQQAEPIRLETAAHSVLLEPLPGAVERSLPVHPTQLYSALNAVLLCLLALAYEPMKRRDGELLALVFTIYPMTRILLEAVRSDEPAVFGTGLTISQNISLGLLAMMVVFWLWLLRQPPVNAATGAPHSPPRRTGRRAPA